MSTFLCATQGQTPSQLSVNNVTLVAPTSANPAPTVNLVTPSVVRTVTIPGRSVVRNAMGEGSTPNSPNSPGAWTSRASPFHAN